jgi:hypothetical protein
MTTELVDLTTIENSSILEYLTNPAYYSIIAKSKPKTETILNKEDTRFYRKRIIALTKEMLKSSDLAPSKGINEAFDVYINMLIKYFKIVDKTDIIQDQYDKDKEVEEDELSNLQEQIDTQVDMDIAHILRGSGGAAPTLNDFVVSTTTHPESRVIPMKLEMNLHSPSLKTKGIKPKKIKKL